MRKSYLNLPALLGSATLSWLAFTAEQELQAQTQLANVPASSRQVVGAVPPQVPRQANGVQLSLSDQPAPTHLAGQPGLNPVWGPRSPQEQEGPEMEHHPFHESESRTWKEALEERGINFEIYATQFFQGVASGGIEQEWEYGGKLDLLAGLEGEKLGLWRGLLVDAHVESRLGKSINDVDGLLLPSNIAMLFPEPEGNITALTGLKITQALSENFAVYAGKINTLDEFPVKSSPGGALGRPGLGGFMNTSLVFNPIVARTVPYSAAGVGFAILENMKPVFTFSVFDPTERATEGLEDLYERGVVLMPDWTLRTTRWGRPGIYNFGGSYSTADYTSVDPSAWLDDPIAPGLFPLESGSWSLYSNFYQALVVDPSNSARTWGVFGAVGIADGNPSPIGYNLAGGFAGHAVRSPRAEDLYGIGFFTVGLSDDFKTLSGAVRPQQDEYGMECFYNWSLGEHLRLTADVQVVRPSTVGLDTAIIPGVRLEAAY